MKNRLVFGWYIIFCLGCFGGCKEPKIDALEDERGIYSVYGALDIDKSPNFIRIRDLRTPLSADSSGLNATVEFEDLETGVTTLLRDSIVEFSGNFTNNFILNEDLNPRKLYQLTVTRPDGNSVSSVATMPGITQHQILPLGMVDCFTRLRIRFQNVIPSEQIRLEVGFSYQGTKWQEVTQYCELERNENTVMLNISTREMLGMTFPAPGTDLISCRQTRSEVSCNDLDSPTVQLRYFHLGPEWQRVYPFYPNDPEDIGDVENGLGFLGGYREEATSYTVRIAEAE